jgi:hypothetical protein
MVMIQVPFQLIIYTYKIVLSQFLMLIKIAMIKDLVLKKINFNL